MNQILENNLLKKPSSNTPTFKDGKLKSYKLTRKNIHFIRIMYSIGNFVCITPWYDFEKHHFLSPVINLVYAILVTAILTSMFFTTIKSKDFMDEQVVHMFLATFGDVISIVLTKFDIVRSSFFKKDKWKVLLDLFISIDDKLENNHTEQYRILSNFYIQLLLGHIYFLGCYTFKAYVWSSIIGMKYFFSFGTMVIPMYYCFFSAMMVSNIALAFHCRYRDLNQLLCKKVESNKRGDMDNFIKEIRVIRKYYRHLGDAVEVFNDMFGWVIVLVVLHSIIELLNCVNLILKSFVDPKLSWGVFISCLWVCSLSMGGAIYIILCCDSASAEGKKIIRLCYKYEEKFETSSACRQELLNLAEFSKNYSPDFIAANFFVVERSSILGIISIATTYLIVVIQFNGTLSHNL